jgi:large subunit ribosomal protein L1
MAKHSKKHLAAREEVGTEPRDPRSAVELAKKVAHVKFEEAVEAHFLTSADPRHADQQVREVAILPHGTGRPVRVLVFAEGDAARIAKEAGADYVADPEIIKQIEDGWSDFEISIATPDQMGKIGRLGRYLGRKGLMPNPRTGTVVQPDAIAQAIQTAKKGRSEIRMDRTSIIHTRLGTVGFTEDQLLDNLASVYGTILRARPSGVKGQFIKTATLCTTMGPGIALDLNGLEELAARS